MHDILFYNQAATKFVGRKGFHSQNCVCLYYKSGNHPTAITVTTALFMRFIVQNISVTLGAVDGHPISSYVYIMN